MIDEKRLLEEINRIIFEADIHKSYVQEVFDDIVRTIKEQPKLGEWIPVSERLPEERDWYLAVFKEIDTDFVLIPRVADYVGKETTITTSDNWIIIDLEEPTDYLRILECIAWMPLPEPYKEGE